MTKSIKQLTSFLIALVFALLPASALANDGTEDAILILDASGSMWGQIEGKNKIVIARNVLGQLLDDLPENRRLGLMAYGHNKKGDCSDIEMLAKIGASRSAIKTAVKDINPKGKTPISAAVKRAAENLKYTENKATVILISDGIETCNLDPCALGKQLEKDGIDFTAHVVGFDIVDKKTENQLQCLASSTGGRYLSASNASELSIALGETVKTKQADSAPVKLHLEATLLVKGAIIETGLDWKVQQSGGGDVLYESDNKGAVTSSVPPGVYDVFVVRPSDGLKGESHLVELKPGANKTVTIALNPEFDASVNPDRKIVDAGTEFSVKWEGPNGKSDFVTITSSGAEARSYSSYSYTSNGNPVKLTAPIEAGDYEVRYVLGRPYKVLARSPITVNKQAASVKGPETAIGGSTILIDWTGPATKQDIITVATIGSAPRSYIKYFYTENRKTPHKLAMPVEAGDYELRYVFVGKTGDSGGSENRILARKAITIEKALATIDGPETAKTGDTINIDWTGPIGNGDYVTVTKPDAKNNKYLSYKYTKNGSPSKVRMPLEAGDYELRIVQKGGREGYKVLARKPIKITETIASINGPKTALVGEKITVEWEGPEGGSGDFITITAPDAEQRKFMSYAYTKSGSPSKFSMPLKPGDYELRFVQSNSKVIARQSITIKDISMSLNAPKSTKVSEDISVSFEGPTASGDWITIAAPDSKATTYGDYFYPRNGSPQNLTMPKQAGTYEIRYVLHGKRVIAKQEIKVTE